VQLSHHYINQSTNLAALVCFLPIIIMGKYSANDIVWAQHPRYAWLWPAKVPLSPRRLCDGPEGALGRCSS
jgi:hypothetical protein